MAKLIYMTIASLDGYVADAEGSFAWGKPDAEVHAFVNDLERGVGTYLYGRRMYEVMVAWEKLGDEPDHPDHIRDYAEIWRASEKVVYSRTLEQVSSERTRIEREFDPRVVQTMKNEAAGDLSVAGPHLAAEAFKAGLVDECHLVIAPAIVGGGNRSLPDGVRLDLELADERRFANGMAYLRYAVGR